MDSWNWVICGGMGGDGGNGSNGTQNSGYWLQGRAEVSMYRFQFECDSSCRWGIDGTELGDEELRMHGHKDGLEGNNNLGKLDEWYGQGERYMMWRIPRAAGYFDNSNIKWDRGDWNSDGFDVRKNRWYPRSSYRPLFLGWTAESGVRVADAPAFQTHDEEWRVCGA